MPTDTVSADLHQLRGRVGRYKHQAYCYLMVDPHKHLTPEATKRLRAIEEFSQMGAGFAISMRTWRFAVPATCWAPNRAVTSPRSATSCIANCWKTPSGRSKNCRRNLSADVDIDLPVEAYLPADYVPDLRHKIDLYRRIARINNAAQSTNSAKN